MSVLAHPNKTLNENELLNLIDLGIDGIEVIHPSHSQERINYYKGITSEYFLLEGGGSDFHGGRKRDEEILGQYTITGKAVENMKRRLFK